MHDEKPLSEWKFAASINTVISVLGVVSRAALVFAVSSSLGQHKWNWFRERHDELRVFVKFDEASRGLLGSLNLHLWSRVRSWASLGAFVIIISVLIDPFLQAAVSLEGPATSQVPIGTDQYHPVNVRKVIKQTYTSYDVSYGHIRQFDGEFRLPYTDVLLTTFVNTDYSKSVTFQGDNTTFTTFLIMHASRDFLNGSVLWENSWPTATECGFYFCAKAYESSATNGVLTERELGTWAVREPRSWSAPDVYQTEEWRTRPERQQRWNGEHPTMDHTEERLFRSDLQLIIPPETWTTPDTGSHVKNRFNITQTTVMGPQIAINDLFIGAGPVRSVEEHEMQAHCQYLWNAIGNLTAAFDRVAQWLTLEIRDSSADDWSSNHGEHGIAFSKELQIRVRWGFFSVIVATVALGWGYVIGVLVNTHRLGLPAWKTSVYSTLAFAPDGAVRALLRDAYKREGERRSGAVRKVREKLRMELQETEGGFIF
ncbi:hypothetical protein MFIFM68171_08742 [Madurella fahalii]|uniref:Uncharacterized protein n=1 Tax=Madurella fahalii TaxID=1157608 RepID=A0ABQ0GL90_9PEZI